MIFRGFYIFLSVLSPLSQHFYIPVPQRQEFEMAITSLPVEMMSTICSHLQLCGWQAFRLPCRALHSTSIESFSKRYFRTINFAVISDSFCELEALPNSNGIREEAHSSMHSKLEA